MRNTILFILLILIGCTDQRKASESSMKEITQLAQSEGDKISLAAQRALGGQLKKAIMEYGPSYALQFCNTAAYQMLDTLKTDLNVSIKRASLRVRNPKDAPSDIERKILEEYKEQLAVGKEPEVKVEVLSSKQVLYARPIILDNPMCLNCHGKVGSQVSDETYNLIQKLYPKDKAINHQMGDLRGIWSITFDTNELANYLNEIE